MTVRSDRLSGPTAVPSGASITLFVVPAGQTWLVKRLLAQRQLGAGQLHWDIGAGGGGLEFHESTTGADPTDDHETWIALDEGAQLGVRADVGSTFQCASFGAKLAGVA
jgi:hypothetical protein